MQWRLLVRRCPLKSFTVVGDLAQTEFRGRRRVMAGAPWPRCSVTAGSWRSSR